ncbi:amino acid ABC transporter substrate-binding protein [Arsukibacterium sp. MJ3]|uniref:substrate-binding periplasmic protein n=1 Tax=Arsukibacterium sp. MJ3 TaxID=1632859 RepID=UPI0006271DDD|nr:transporter substrate-binding domain-containing protein [Arsukibacterium sp. MJ3]KKO48697.1 amino acid ABC transporter substrate-binding protein [Arsukibacterium sp. MJ3]
MYNILLKATMLTLLLISSLSHAASCTLSLGIETHFPPHIIKTKNGWSGLSVELMQRLAVEVGCEVILIESPWRRSMRLIAQGKLDVISHLTFSPERQQRFAFIGPHHLEHIYLVADPAAIPAVTSLEQLTQDVDLTDIAMLDGAYYGEHFATLQAQAGLRRQLVYIGNNLDKMALLKAGRVNAVLEDLSVLRYWQADKTSTAGRFQPLLEVHQGPVYFGFNKATLSTEQLGQLANAWQQLHRSGELSNIVSRYQQRDSELNVPPPEPHL